MEKTRQLWPAETFALPVTGKSPGVSIAEYALIGVSVLLVSIIALQMLGVSIFGNLALTGQSVGKSGTLQLLDANNIAGRPLPSPRTDVGGSTDSGLARFELEEMRVTLDPVTGQLQFTANGSALNNGGSNTTSSEGTRLLAQAFALMAESGVTPSGEPISDEIRAKLRELAQAGFIIGSEQDNLYQASRNREQKLELDRIQSAMGVYSSRYDAFNNVLAGSRYSSDPAMAELQTLIAQYSGIISQSAYSSATYYNDKLPGSQNQLDGNLKASLVGTPIPEDGLTITLATAATVTNTAATGIDAQAN